MPHPNCDPCCGGGFSPCVGCDGSSASQYRVTISGVANKDCSACDDYNGVFILDRLDEACRFVFHFDYPYPCGNTWEPTAYVLDLNLNTGEVVFQVISYAALYNSWTSDSLTEVKCNELDFTLDFNNINNPYFYVPTACDFSNAVIHIEAI